MQNFLSLWLNAGAQITHGGQVQRPRQKKIAMHPFLAIELLALFLKNNINYVSLTIFHGLCHIIICCEERKNVSILRVPIPTN